MEPLTSYLIAHTCLAIACSLLTHADNQPLPPSTGYLGGNSNPRPIKPQATLWF